MRTQVDSRLRFRRRAPLLTLVAVCACGAFAYGTLRGSASLGELELTLEEAVALPGNWTVRDFLPLRDGSTLFILHNPGRVSWLPDSASVLRMPSRVVIGARETDDGTVELVDRVHRVVFRVSPLPDVEVVESRPISTEEMLWDAEWTDDRWLVLAGDSVAPATVYAVESGMLRQLGPPLRQVPARLARFSTVAGRTLVAELIPPFRVFALDGEGWRVVSPAESDRAMPAFSTALDVIDLGGTALQTLVDQTSHRRILRVFSLETRIGRERVIEAPVSLTKVDAQGRIVGIRASQVEELVRYSWRWR